MDSPLEEDGFELVVPLSKRTAVRARHSVSPSTAQCCERSKISENDDFAFPAAKVGTTADRPQLKKLMDALAPGDVVVTPAVDRLSRDATDLLVIARDMQRAGAGLRSIADVGFRRAAELVLATLGVAAKLERRRILERTARGRADAKAKGDQIRPPADAHPAPAAGGPRTRRRRRDAAQRRPQLQRQSEHDFAAYGMMSPL